LGALHLSSRGCRGLQQTIDSKVGEDRGEKRSHHALAGVNNSLMCASHASVYGCLKGSRLVSTEAKDAGEHDGATCVVLNVEEERRSSFKNFDSRS
jgi:hypothetical protein